ncbi:MAG: hypothetical protein K8T25_11105 [Planctomycetia bacterium]|nr:hypothetical protein [Planctomycetia bacterium]
MCLLAGCGSDGVPRVAVEGNVLLDDKPVPFATIQFIPAADTPGPLATATVIDGHYRLAKSQGPPIGKLRVEIRTDYGRLHPTESPEQIVRQFGGAPPDPIPARYHRDSILEATTEAGGSNVFSFSLTSKPE